MKIVVIGGGLSGKGAERLAKAAGHEVAVVSDGAGINENEIFSGVELIVVSPGVKPVSALYTAARKLPVEIISELEFGFRHFPNRLLAITGTNGKTTTTELTVHLLNAIGINAVGAGNIGLPLSEIAADLIEGKTVSDLMPVVEVSSFQLERASEFAPLAAAMLNLDSDHLDRYPGGMEEYGNVKRKIFSHVSPENRIFGITLNENREYAKVTVNGSNILLNGKLLIDFNELKLKGAHNLENLLAALELVARVVPEGRMRGISFLDALKSFSSGAHRMETVNIHNGVEFINDSKATNPASVVAALNALKSRGITGVHIILGGLDKDMDFGVLNQYSDFIREAYMIGECRKKITGTICGTILCADFGTDFPAAIKAAARNAVAGEAVLLSPGCASMDMFKDYRHRGDVFRETVDKICQ